ncbi:MAG: class II fructose-bisphosphatase [Pseudomonadota bacterium]
MTSDELNHSGLDRELVLEVARVTEAAAIAAARFRGLGNERAADGAAVDAMHRELARLAIVGCVVLGEGSEDEAGKLYIGEAIGAGGGPEVDIAADPLEGSTICAKGLSNALSVVAIAEKGRLLRVPSMYMNKIAIGPGYPEGLVDLDAKPGDNLARLAEAKGVAVSGLTACILDRPRNGELIRQVREAGAAIKLIPDGDIAGVIWTTEPEETGIDIYLGIGGAPEGVLAAAALSCIGGQIQGRLTPISEEDRRRARRIGIDRIDRKYGLADMASGDVIFSATGVTDGSLLDGVWCHDGIAETETLVMRASTGTVRRIKTTSRAIGQRSPQV